MLVILVQGRIVVWVMATQESYASCLPMLGVADAADHSLPVWKPCLLAVSNA